MTGQKDSEKKGSVCIIPARGGSKRIPGKNIKKFAGKPIIAYSIEVALASGLFGQVVVSTDSEEIAEIAREYGASVPCLRPRALADDRTGVAEVVRHALLEMREGRELPVYGCCILATAPFLQPEFLKSGYDRINEADSALAV